MCPVAVLASEAEPPMLNCNGCGSLPSLRETVMTPRASHAHSRTSELVCCCRLRMASLATSINSIRWSARVPRRMAYGPRVYKPVSAFWTMRPVWMKLIRYMRALLGDMLLTAASVFRDIGASASVSACNKRNPNRIDWMPFATPRPLRPYNRASLPEVIGPGWASAEVHEHVQSSLARQDWR